MKILVLSQYFWPETFVINDFVKNLKKEGHEVTIATGKPNYPGGKIFDGYSSGGVMHEKFDQDVDVYRVPLRPRKSGALNLVLNYMSFIFSGLIYFPFLFRKKKFDLIFVFAPSPILQAIPAILLKWLHRAHLSIWVQDLWPESLSATKFVTNKYILSAVGVVVRIIYYFCDSLLIQSRAFESSMVKLTDKRKLFYFPNVYKISETEPSLKSGLSEDLLKILNENFCFVFAGNLGTAQSLPTILDAAEKIKDLPNVKVVVVGSGSQSNWLQSQVTSRALTNVYIAGRYDSNCMPELYALSRVMLVTLAKDPIFELTVPSKIQSYMSAGKPILAAIDGEGARIIQEAGAGYSVEAENSVGLAALMRKFVESDELQLKSMGINAKEYFLKNFELSTQIKYFGSLFAELLKRK